jgi:hypothetical protein
VLSTAKPNEWNPETLSVILLGGPQRQRHMGIGRSTVYKLLAEIGE